MKIVRHLSNGVEIDFDLINASREQLTDFCRQIPEHNVMVMKNFFHPKDKITNVFYTIAGQSHESPGNGKEFYTDDDFQLMQRVTNRRDQNGKKIGLFADLDLGWHCNNSPRKKCDKTTLVLQCIQPGDRRYGITSFVNTRQAYRDLPCDIKQLVDKIQIEISFDVFRGAEAPLHATSDFGYMIQPDDPEYGVFSISPSAKPGLFKPLVNNHLWHSDKALYFLSNHIKSWRHVEHRQFDSLELWNQLSEHVYQEKYMYHHEWEPGDVIFNDQWFGFHKRTEVRGDRYLNRWCIPTKGLVAY